MIPLNYSINYAAELAQSPRLVHRQLSSRCMSAISLPIELLALAENAIKLPFQAAACSIKLPITLLNMIIRSKTLRERADSLTSLKDLIQTTLKVIGYTTSFFLTATIGLISPYQNFKVHCTLSLTTDRAAEKARLLQNEKRRQQIAAYEAVLATYLHQVILAIQKQQAQLVSQYNEQADVTSTSEAPIKELPAPATSPDSSLSQEPLNQQTTDSISSPPQPTETAQEQMIEASGTDSQDIPVIPQAIPTEPQPAAVEPQETTAEPQETSILLDKTLEEPLVIMNSNQAATMEG